MRDSINRKKIRMEKCKNIKIYDVQGMSKTFHLVFFCVFE